MDATAQSNRELYDRIASSYEQVDGRRSEVPEYITDNISFTELGKDKLFLDLGAGTGFVAKIARHYFEEVWAADISKNMLAQIENRRIKKVVCDCRQLPFVDGTFDKVVCFSVLHHIADYSILFKEVWRVLKRGGFFYSDHDIDRTFARAFRYPLKLYRMLRDPAWKYGVSKKLWDEAEVHSDGVDSEGMIRELRRLGFYAEATYHWFGNFKAWPRGLAPLTSLWGAK